MKEIINFFLFTFFLRPVHLDNKTIVKAVCINETNRLKLHSFHSETFTTHRIPYLIKRSNTAFYIKMWMEVYVFM